VGQTDAVESPLHRNAVRVQEAATAAGLEIEIKTFPDGTKTAADAAAAIGVQVGQIVKSLVFAVGDPAHREQGEIVMALVSGDHQLSEKKLATVCGAIGCWKVDADAVRDATGYPIGGVAPLGHPTPLRIFADPGLLRFDEVWAAAGTWEHVFGVAPAALFSAAGAVEADVRK
jgi:prolyl-tRNA editing enzyme YbaK/EbsC (Cys-tRNA(Pro) deacylase)